MNMDGVGGRFLQRIWGLSTIGKLVGEFCMYFLVEENHLFAFARSSSRIGVSC